MRHIDFRRLLDARGELAPQHGRALTEAAFAAAAVTSATTSEPLTPSCPRCGRDEPKVVRIVRDDGRIQVRCPACRETVEIVRWQGSRWDAGHAAGSTGPSSVAAPDRDSEFSLRSFLAAQDAARLADLLVDLADVHDAVRARLDRLRHADDPAWLEQSLRATLDHWVARGRWRDWRDGQGWTFEAGQWLDEVAAELMPVDPRRALGLFEAFIEADAVWWEEVNDQDDHVGDLIRAACRHWLDAAARCGPPPGGWHRPLLGLVAADAYGARDELLRAADRLLDDAVLRSLIRAYQDQNAAAAHGLDEPTPVDVPALSAIGRERAADLLAEALGDPDRDAAALRSRATPSEVHERMTVARRYLDKGRPADALAWMDEATQIGAGVFDDLRSQALVRLDRRHEAVAIQEGIFRRTLSADHWRAWADLLEAEPRRAAAAVARQLALAHRDPVAAAELLLAVGDSEAAETVLVTAAARIDGSSWWPLVPLARAMREADRPRGETAVLRALLDGILDRANFRAYHHAADHWHRLREIAAMGVALQPLVAHEVYEAEVLQKHRRKPAFWAHVRGDRAVVRGVG